MFSALFLYITQQFFLSILLNHFVCQGKIKQSKSIFGILRQYFFQFLSHIYLYKYVHRQLILQSPMFCFKVIKLESWFFLCSVSKFVPKIIHGSQLTAFSKNFCSRYAKNITLLQSNLIVFFNKLPFLTKLLNLTYHLIFSYFKVAKCQMVCSFSLYL